MLRSTMSRFLHLAVVAYILLSGIALTRYCTIETALISRDTLGCLRGFGTSPLTIADSESSVALALANNDRFAKLMEEEHANISARHQTKFLGRMTLVESSFNRAARYQADTGEFGAIILSENFAYLHIWKSGGTTIEYQAHQLQKGLSHPEITKRDLMTFVRDPIDHFLSGWAEAGMRVYEEAIQKNLSFKQPKWENQSYDERVHKFLKEVKSIASQGTSPEMTDHMHAFPQANFMINENGEINRHVKVVGDLQEMQQVLPMAGFTRYDEGIVGRDSSENSIKKTHFPYRKDLLSRNTMRELCQFLAMDYYLFAFDPPSDCVGDGGPLDFTETNQRSTFS
jgi:hypothetical protein